MHEISILIDLNTIAFYQNDKYNQKALMKSAINVLSKEYIDLFQNNESNFILLACFLKSLQKIKENNLLRIAKV